MTQPRHIAVIDIGKTNAKLALVDLPTLTEIAVVTRPNIVQSGPPWPHFDVEGHWLFLLNALADFHRTHRIDTISITTHGASVALLDKSGGLAAPILDYEHTALANVATQYDAIRPAFEKTGSPRLAGGLNVGAQLHWQFLTDPTLLDRTEKIVMYPQYWGHRLTKVAATDVTSIGCHTDLWQPHDSQFSELVDTLGIADKVAPVRKSSDVLGSITTAIAQQTGLRPDTPVAVGIHDSNASLYPHLLTQKGPFSVVSTGTWVVVMTMGGAAITLNPARDTLINVNAHGDAVPSARFMGGREYEIITVGNDTTATIQDVSQLIAQNVMLLPAIEPSTGPYQNREMRWIGQPPEHRTALRTAAVSLYLAMMTDTCLRLTGAQGPTIVEGPFAKNAVYMAMLFAATGRPVLHSQSATGTSIGAALLMGSSKNLGRPVPLPKPDHMDQLVTYAAKWRKNVDQTPDMTRA